ncbi:MAG TPA: hypothetical protein VM943_05790 [Pyrinomonadaceae bacterium]|nr:hypothetical protein [Pyrinomonadaceae bacterium]
MKKNFAAAAFSLFSIIATNTLEANAQSCPNNVAFGARQPRTIDRSLQSRIEVTYFTTNDPNVFISERAGIKRSGSTTNLSTAQFVASIEKLERGGAASIRKRQSALSYLGEMAELNLEREPHNANARFINASRERAGSDYIFGLDRETDISIYQGSPKDGDYYRVSVLSWFVEATSENARKTVDYDANILLKPGQTVVFKLMSDDEIRRSGAARSHVAVTLRSVSTADSASREHNGAVAALK